MITSISSIAKQTGISSHGGYDISFSCEKKENGWHHNLNVTMDGMVITLSDDGMRQAYGTPVVLPVATRKAIYIAMQDAITKDIEPMLAQL